MRAAAEHHIGRPFDIRHAPLGRPADNSHHFPFGIEGNFLFERRGLLQFLFRQHDLCRRHQQRAFRRIADDLPGSIFLPQRRPVAEHRGRQQPAQAGKPDEF